MEYQAGSFASDGYVEVGLVCGEGGGNEKVGSAYGNARQNLE